MRLVPCEYFLDEGECLWRCRIDQMPAGEQRSASVEHACHRVGHFALLRGDSDAATSSVGLSIVANAAASGITSSRTSGASAPERLRTRSVCW
jgi:hypothetical protein